MPNSYLSPAYYLVCKGFPRLNCDGFQVSWDPVWQQGVAEPKAKLKMDFLVSLLGDIAARSGPDVCLRSLYFPVKVSKSNILMRVSDMAPLSARSDALFLPF